MRLKWAKGWKIVWRHAGPPVSVMIGAMTLTSWARQAAVTRSAWFEQRDAAAAEGQRILDVVDLLEDRRRHRPAFLTRAARLRRVRYHTFHSSKLSMMRLDERRRAATASAIATTSSMKLSIRSQLARKAGVSPS